MNKRDSDALPATGGISVARGLTDTATAAGIAPVENRLDRRVGWITLLSIALGAVSAFVAVAMLWLIALMTNISFFGRFSAQDASPADHHLGVFVIVVPIAGALIVGIMARYGSAAIRGHGIPEAMEQVLLNQSRIPPRITWLKPVSTAVSIGTGGPFGAEGPVIATGGSLGSLVGQMLSTTAGERKTLLAAGAAAGMSAIFGTPVAAVLLAVELLLFEFRAASIIPVAAASAAAAGLRTLLLGHEPMFPMPDLATIAPPALAIYVGIGLVAGVASAGVTRLVYGIEDLFDHLPLHWMWWPAIGAVVVGIVGYFEPRTLGVGYNNITDILSGSLLGQAALLLCTLKFISWSVALGSGTSGGTLAPLMTIGAGLGSLLGVGAARFMPSAGVDIHLAALVGMAALFAGASRAMLASAVFAFETTRQPEGLLALLAACCAAQFVAAWILPNSIMTEKIARRGVVVPADYHADVLEQVSVAQAATRKVRTLRVDQRIAEVRTWLASGAAGSTHQGFPLLDEKGILAGVLTRRDLAGARDGDAELRTLLRRPPVIVYSDCNLREAVDHMVRHDLGRLPVVERGNLATIIGIITRSDVLAAYRRRLEESIPQEPNVAIPGLPRRSRSKD